MTGAPEDEAASSWREARHDTGDAAHPLRVFTLRGAAPGPTLALLGAVHGDEMEGPLALSRLMAGLDPDALAGALIVAPLVNAAAAAAGTRCTPADGGNLARSFPGDPAGSYTQRLAALVAQQVIERADALVDLHSGGTALDCPLLIGWSDTPGETGLRSAAMARAFGAPVMWRHPPPMPRGRTLTHAEDTGIPAIYTEAGGGTAPPGSVVDAYHDGVLRVMEHLGMIRAATPPPPVPLCLAGQSDIDAAIDAPVSGLCTPHIAPLDIVRVGQPCFDISDIDGKLLTTVHATASARAVFVRRSRWVGSGDLLMALAVEELCA